MQSYNSHITFVTTAVHKAREGETALGEGRRGEKGRERVQQEEEG